MVITRRSRESHTCSKEITRFSGGRSALFPTRTIGKSRPFTSLNCSTQLLHLSNDSWKKKNRQWISHRWLNESRDFDSMEKRLMAKKKKKQNYRLRHVIYDYSSIGVSPVLLCQRFVLLCTGCRNDEGNSCRGPVICPYRCPRSLPSLGYCHLFVQSSLNVTLPDLGKSERIQRKR